MASMACLGALRRTPGDISIMSNLEILLEGFQKFRPVAPRIDTLVSMVKFPLQARSSPWINFFGVNQDFANSDLI